MNLVIALPPEDQAPKDIQSIFTMLAQRFAEAEQITLVSHVDDQAYYTGIAKQAGLQTQWADKPPKTVPDHFIAIHDREDQPPTYTAPKHSKKIYSLGKNRRLHLTNSWLDGEVDPYVSHHVFNHCTPPTGEPLFAFAPYNYLFRYPGIGAYNQYGHRVPADYHTLAERDKNHKLIAVFGGSACWSIFCYDHEVFTKRLEQKLNEDQANQGLTFTVLNFGLPGNIILNESIAYLLHCHHIKPDIVIGHDGFNDMFYGATSDPKLVRDHSIVYQFNLEEWAHTIKADWYESASQPLAADDHDKLMQPEWPLNLHNLPQDIIRAYCQRKLQFRELVENAGAKFIWGIQPYLHSKENLSEDEQQYLASLANDTTVRDIYRRIPFLYEKLDIAQKAYAGDSLINFDTVFTDFSADETHFADYCHLTPLGDEVLAEHYHRHIINQLLPDME